MRGDYGLGIRDRELDWNCHETAILFLDSSDIMTKGPTTNNPPFERRKRALRCIGLANCGSFGGSGWDLYSDGGEIREICGSICT